MSNLTACIKRAGKALRKDDATDIVGLRDRLLADGVGHQEAANQAISLHLESLFDEREELGQKVKTAGSIMPALSAIEHYGSQDETPTKQEYDKDEQDTEQTAPANDEEEEVVDDGENRDIHGEQRGESLDSPAPNAGQRESSLFIDPSATGKEKRSQLEDQYATTTANRQTGKLKTGITKISSPEDLAHLVAPIRKMAQERFIIVVTDSNDEILLASQHSTGLKANSLVDPLTVVAQVAGIGGAATVHYAHNHPSGENSSSKSDQQITRRLIGVLDGTGIDPGYHVIVGKGTKAVSIAQGGDQEIDIPAMPRNKSVPVVERALVKRGKLGPVVNNPRGAETMIRGIHSDNAIILLDAQHAPLGTLALSEDEMLELRKDGRVSRVLKAYDLTNASAAMIKSVNSDAAKNVAKFLNSLDAKVLDVFSEDAGKWVSSAQSGAMLEGSTGAWYRSDEAQFSGSAALSEKSTPQGMPEAEVKKHVEAFLKTYKGADDLLLKVHGSQDNWLGKNSRKRLGRVKGGFVPETNSLHIIADNIENAGDLQATLQHEIFVHKGLGIFSEAKQKELLDLIVNEVPNSKRLAPLWAEVQKDYHDKPLRTQAEELLARIAERNYKGLDKAWAKILNWFRSALEQMGFIKPQLTRSELMQHVYNIGNAFREGQVARQRSVAEEMYRIDEDGFVHDSHDSLDFGEITADISKNIRRQAGPIRLEVGNDRRGLQHIKKEHLGSILSAGFSSAEELVEHVAKNFNEIRQGGSGRLMLVVTPQSGSKVGKAAIINLKKGENGDFYSVETASPWSERSLKKRVLLWEGTAEPSTNAGNQFRFGSKPEDGASQESPLGSTDGQSKRSIDHDDENGILFNKVVREADKSREAMNQRIKGDDKGIWYKAHAISRRYLAPGGLLPKMVFDAKIKRDSEMGAIEMDVKSHVWALELAFKKDFKKPFDKRSDTEESLMRDALRGKPVDLPESTAISLEVMRQYIDTLSGRYVKILQQDMKDLVTGLDTEETLEQLRDILNGDKAEGAGPKVMQVAQKITLLQTITRNTGTYVNRSYQAFDDPRWPKKVPENVLNDARDYLENQYLAQNEEASQEEAAEHAQIVIESILKEGTAFDNMEAMIKESKLGAKDLSLLKQRKDIAPEIRALLGEYTDPRLNFAMTTTKMTNLIINDDFLKHVKTIGMGVFLFEDGKQPEGAWKTIAAEGNESYAPLNGLKTTPEIHQAFQDALGKEQMAAWYRTIVQLNGMVKFGKTILSPTTAARNWMSAFFFSMANGHFDQRHMEQSIKSMRSYFKGQGKELAYLRKLKELGVIYDTPYAGEMMRLLDDTDMAASLLTGRMKAQHALNWAQKFYQFGDDYHKIIGFENEKRLLMKHYKLTMKEAEVKAAERIRNTYPTYSMVPKAINSLRRFPLAGTFVSFPAEIVRTSFHIIKYAQEDMKQSKALGARRVAGIALASGLAYAAQEMSKMMLGLDDDEEEAVRNQAAPWSKNSNMYFLSREGGNLRYLDLSFLDPYNYWKRPLTAVMRDEPVDDMAIEAAREFLQPFLGQDIAFGAVSEVWNNKTSYGGPVYNESDLPPQQLKKIANHLRKNLQPGAFSNLERIIKAYRGERTATTKYKLNDEMLALVGFRVSTLDPGMSLKYFTYDTQDTLRNASSILSRVARDPNPVTEKELRSTFDRVSGIKDHAYGDLLKSIKSARKSGIGDAAVETQLRAGGLSKNDSWLLSNGDIPRKVPTSQYLKKMVESAGDTFGSEIQEEMQKRKDLIIQWSEERAGNTK